MSEISIGRAVLDVYVRVHGETELAKLRSEQNKIIQQSYIMRRALSVTTGIIVAKLLRALGETAISSMEVAASFNQLRLNFLNFTRDTALTLQDLRDATMGLVSDVDLLRTANEALARGIPASELEEMFRIGALLGEAHRTAAEGIQLMIDGVGKMRAEHLKNLGITLTTSEAYRLYAENLGKTATQLTDAEKQQAVLNLALERGNEALRRSGEVIDPLNKSYKEFINNWKSFKNFLGTGLLVWARAIVFEPINTAADALNRLMTAARESLYGVPTESNLEEAVRGASDAVDELEGSVLSAREELEEFAKSMGFASLETYKAYVNLFDYVDAAERVRRNQEEVNSEVSRAIEDLQRQQDEYYEAAKAVEEYNELLRQYQLQQVNVANAVKYATGEITRYEDAVDTSTWTNREAVEAYESLASALEPLRRRQLALAEVLDRYNSKLSQLEYAMSEARLEYEEARRAVEMLRREREAEIASLDEEIAQLELLGARQGFLTFDQRRRLNTLMVERRQMADTSSTLSDREQQYLEAVNQKYSDLAYQHSKLLFKMRPISDEYDLLTEKISLYEEKADILVSTMNRLAAAFERVASAAEELGVEFPAPTAPPGVEAPAPAEPEPEKPAPKIPSLGEAKQSYRRKHGSLRGFDYREFLEELGVVPAQHGFIGTVTRPTLFLAGEAGRETVAIAPQGAGRAPVNQVSVTINVSGDVGSSVGRRSVARELGDAFVEELVKRGVKLF